MRQETDYTYNSRQAIVTKGLEGASGLMVRFYDYVLAACDEARRQGRGDEVFPYNATVARELRCSVRSVSRVKAGLAKRGLIVIREQYRSVKIDGEWIGRRIVDGLKVVRTIAQATLRGAEMMKRRAWLEIRRHQRKLMAACVDKVGWSPTRVPLYSGKRNAEVAQAQRRSPIYQDLMMKGLRKREPDG